MDIVGSRQLLQTCEVRFASQIYSSERILEDKIYIEQFFTCTAMVDYFNSSHPSAVLTQEFHDLKNTFIFNIEAWEKLKGFVGIELPVRYLLRISDGHTPNLALLARHFELAQNESMTAATLYSHLFPQVVSYVKSMFQKREKDIVTKLVLAAGMVLPQLVYCLDNLYSPNGGEAAMTYAIERYYPDVDDQILALTMYGNFREKTGIFSEKVIIVYASTRSPDEFWKEVSRRSPSPGSELFRKLCNGFAGQGESDRMNKTVTKIRTTNRNRQNHDVTKAFMQLDSTFKMIEKRKSSYDNSESYICMVRNIIRDIEQEEVELKREKLKNSIDLNINDFEDIDEDDIEFDNDIEEMDLCYQLIRNSTGYDTTNVIVDNENEDNSWMVRQLYFYILYYKMLSLNILYSSS